MPFFFWGSQWSAATVRFDLIGIPGKPSFRAENMRCFGVYAVLALCIYGVPATAEERFERWSLERPGDLLFALSHSSGPFRSMIEPPTSELAFVCNQEEKYVAVLLIPLDGTFKSRQNSVPVVSSEEPKSNLMRRT